MIFNLPNPKKLAKKYRLAKPIPHISIDNLVKKKHLIAAHKEFEKVKTHQWRVFTRNNSYMEECYEFTDLPNLRDMIHNFNSTEFIKWLEALSGIKGLIPDPHGVGGGIMRCKTGDHLKIHTDFNWNDELRLHRVMSIILYFSKNWKKEWNGDLQFWDQQRKKMIRHYYPEQGRILIWNYHKRGFHGHPIPLATPKNIYRDGLRMFYFLSDSTYKKSDPPHQSYYWYDEKSKTPYNPKKRMKSDYKVKRNK